MREKKSGRTGVEKAEDDSMNSHRKMNETGELYVRLAVNCTLDWR